MIEPDPEEQLLEEFLGTPEGEAWDNFMQQGREAIERGDATVEMPTAFLALILPELSSPFDFLALKQAWNRLCDERGRADLKKTVPELVPESDDEPF